MSITQKVKYSKSSHDNSVVHRPFSGAVFKKEFIYMYVLDSTLV